MNVPKPYNGSEKYVFISYSHRDTYQVFPIISHMISQGYRVWFDEGIDPGTEWDNNIAQHIIKSGYFIAFVSNSYLASTNCMDELSYARDVVDERLIVYLEDVQLPSGVAMRTNRLQSIFKFKYANEHDFYSKLYAANNLNLCRNNFSPSTGGTYAGGTYAGGTYAGGSNFTGGGTSMGSGATGFIVPPAKEKSRLKLVLAVILLVISAFVFIGFVSWLFSDDSDSPADTDLITGTIPESYDFVIESNGQPYSDGVLIGEAYYNKWAGLSIRVPSGFELSSEEVCASYSDEITVCVLDYTAADSDSLTLYFVDVSGMDIDSTSEYLQSYADILVENRCNSVRTSIADSQSDEVAQATKFNQNVYVYDIAGEQYLRYDVTVDGNNEHWCFGFSVAFRDNRIVVLNVVGDSIDEMDELYEDIKEY